MNMHGDSLLNELNAHDEIILPSLVDKLPLQASKRTCNNLYLHALYEQIHALYITIALADSANGIEFCIWDRLRPNSPHNAGDTGNLHDRQTIPERESGKAVSGKHGQFCEHLTVRPLTRLPG